MFCQIKNNCRSIRFATLVKVCAGLALLSLAACSGQRDISEGVQLLLNTEELEPTTTFELRFEQPVAASEEVGQQARSSPLLIDPPLAGSFAWLSQRSGLFTPSEPPALGQVYRFSLRAGPAPHAGGYGHARLRRTLRTPPLSVSGIGGFDVGSSNAISEPEIKIQFNAEVKAQQAASFCDFRNGSGARVPAQVRQGTDNDYLFRRSNGAESSRLTWKQQFYQNIDAPSVRLQRSRHAAPAEEMPIRNRLVITPARPLPAARGWRLVIDRNIPSTETSSRLSEPYEVAIGDVTPFALAGVSAENYLQDGKSLTLSFSKQISGAVDTNNWADWVAISPRPTNLSVWVQNYGLSFRGDFLINTSYSVRVRSGFPAEEAFTLAAESKRTVEFAPLPPRLYFPAFSTTQLEGGSRRFHLLTLNVPQVRVRAKQLDRSTLIHALRGYGSYYKHQFEDHDYLEPYREVDFNLVPGKTIFDEVIDGVSDRNGASAALAPDHAQKVALDWDRILHPGQAGAVFLAAERPGDSPSHGKLGTQALVQLTDLGLAWKYSREEAAVYVFSHATGKPVSSATVYLMSEENEALAECKTDTQGLARLPLEGAPARNRRTPEPDETGWSSKGRWLLVESGHDLHAVPLEHEGLPLYGYNIPVDWWSGEKQNRAVMLFSDRPIYRPGETVHLKSIVRDWRESRLAIPAGAVGELRCFDPKGEKFFETNVTFSALGSWAESVPLTAGALGQYRAELKLGGQDYGHWFQVQEFQPNAFEISLKAKSVYGPGEKVELPLSARYFMGKGLSRAQVRWSAEVADSGFAPAAFEDFVFGTAVEGELGREASSFALQGEGLLSNKTGFAIAPEITFNPKAPQPRSVNLFVEVTDLNQQTLSQSAHFTCLSSDFYLGLKSFKEVVRAGEPVRVEVVAVRPDGSPCPEVVQAHVTFQHIEWRTVRVQSAGRARSYRSEPIITNILEQEVVTRALQRTGDKWELQPSTNPPPMLLPQEAGLYLIEVRAKDAGGREVVTALTFNVIGKDELAWNYRNEAQIDLTPDQKNYMAGETATVLVKAPFSGTALVTVEREKVLRSFVMELTGHAPAVQVPLETNDAPNVFVSVILVRGSADNPKRYKRPEYRVGYCQLNVARPESKLVVSIEPSAPDYRPGETVHIATTVKDFTGQPAAGAEVTLYAVDEGILSLTGYATPDPYAFFYKTRPLSVHCGLSLPNLLPEDPEQLEFHNKGYLVGGGGRSERLRKNFLPCAFWDATLRTGSDGRVEASFVAPDSLTRYRVIAVAHSAASQFGSSQASFQINKPLMIEPALPRFANITDRILARAVVHNETDQAREVEVSLQLDDKAKAAPVGQASRLAGVTEVAAGTPPSLVRGLPVGARSSIPIEFPLEFISAGTATWIWKARFTDETRNPKSEIRNNPENSNEEIGQTNAAHHALVAPKSGEGRTRTAFTDAVQSTLTVGHVMPLLREIYLSRTEAAETNLLARANPQLLEGKGALTVSVSNSRLSELGEAVSQLLHYPYGCVEQTSSSLLPWLVLRQAPAVIPQLNQPPAEIEAAIQGGVKRLLSMQTRSGGLSYWPGGAEPMLWGSAYGGLALALAARQGVGASQGHLDRLMNYLSLQLRTSAALDGRELSDRCLALYTLALAGRAEAAYQEVLFARRELLPAESRALLALAILESKGPAPMAAELLQGKTSPRASEDDYFGCGAREIAVRLLAWTRHQPAAPAVDALVEELMKGQKAAHWGTTQGNAWALYALTEYARRVESEFKPATGAISFAGQGAPFELAGKAMGYECSFPFGAAPASTPLALSNPLHRLLFTKVKLETRPPALQQSRVDRGYLVQRTYNKLDDGGQPQGLEALRVGDSVLISLHIEVRQPAHYVAVDDALPALFEAINPEVKSQQTRSGSTASLTAGVSSENWFSDFSELRADRALFFRNHLGPGSYNIRYRARVRAAGTATAPPTKVEEMYHPGRFGLSDTVKITSLPLE